MVNIGYIDKRIDGTYGYVQLNQKWSFYNFFIIECEINNRILHSGIIVPNEDNLKATSSNILDFQIKYSPSDNYSISIYFDFTNKRIYGNCKNGKIRIYGHN